MPRVAILLASLLLLSFAAQQLRALEPSVVIEATLEEKSPLPSMADIFVYREGLVTYRYRVDKVVSGELRERSILVTHWGVQRAIVQPVSEMEIGASTTLRLRPFADLKEQKLDEVFRTDLSHPQLLVFHDVGQQLVTPAAGRWDYVADVTRNMRAFHALKNQLKLVVIGDCQTWFSNNPALHYAEENARTPVALTLTQERSDLPFYDGLAEHYLSKMPQLEWVVVGWHTRWVNGRASWRGQREKTQEFFTSPGFQFDSQHSSAVWAATGGDKVTIDQLKNDEDLWRLWQRHPYGAITGIDSDQRSQAAAQREAERSRANWQFSQQRWDQWLGIVEKLTASDVKVLIYTLPIHPATGKQDVKDKAGTTAEGYAQQVALMRELEKQFPDQVFFYDLNQAGKHNIDGKHFRNMDHLTSEGADIATKKVEAFRRKIAERLGPSQQPEPANEEKSPAASSGGSQELAEKYQELLKQRLITRVGEGARIRFAMGHLFRGQEVQVEAADDAGARVSNGSMATKLPVWDVLPAKDLAALARALAKGSKEPSDAALAAYYSFAASEDTEARRHLASAGDHAEAIQQAFPR